MDWMSALQGAAGVALIGLVGVLIKEVLGHRQSTQARAVERDKVGIAMAAEQRQEFLDLITTYKGLITPLQEHAQAVDDQLVALRAQAVATEAANAAAAAITTARLSMLGHEHATCLKQVLYLSQRIAALEDGYAGAATSDVADTPSVSCG